jgi:hypothetical protein
MTILSFKTCTFAALGEVCYAQPQNTKALLWRAFDGKGKPCGDLLSHGSSALSLARSRFTVLFGMGRGGSETLWPQGEGFGSRGSAGMRASARGLEGVMGEMRLR